MKTKIILGLLFMFIHVFYPFLVNIRYISVTNLGVPRI